MKNKFKKIVKQAQRLALSRKEKDDMKSALLRHIAENPAEQGIVWYETPKFFSMSFLGRPVERAFVPALVCILVIGVGGATFASQVALPGDVLYPVKIMNEKVELGLTFDSSAIAKVEEKHAITRLTEVEKLSQTGKLDEKKKVELTDAFNKSSEKAIEHIGQVYDKNKEQGKKAFGDFKANVKARKDTLRNISSQDDDFVRRLSSSTRSIAEKIDSEEKGDNRPREQERQNRSD